MLFQRHDKRIRRLLFPFLDGLFVHGIKIHHEFFLVSGCQVKNRIGNGFFIFDNIPESPPTAFPWIEKISHPRIFERHRAVAQVLDELDVKEKETIILLNKIDLLNDEDLLEQIKVNFPGSIAISAQKRINIESLLSGIQRYFQSRMTSVRVFVPHSRMDLVQIFYKNGKVKEVTYSDDGVYILSNFPKALFHNILKNKEIKIVD